MKYLKGLAVIIAACFAGEILRAVIPLPIPAGIYGLVIMFLLLCFRLIKLETVEKTADFLIEAMSIMFIPGGVAIMFAWDTLKTMLPAVLGAVFLVTPLVMFVTGRVSQHIIDKEAGK